MSKQSVFSNDDEPRVQGGNASIEGFADAGGVGQQLRSAREARKLSVPEVAQSLKLAPRQVEAIESEDWGALPGNTMIRGFVRNYARVLNLDADALMRGLDATRMQRTLQLEASAGTSSHLPQADDRAERRDYLAVVGGLVLLVLALLAYFYVPQDFWREQLAALTGSETPRTAAELQPSVSEPAATGVAPLTVPSTVIPAQSALERPGAAIVPSATVPPDGRAPVAMVADPAAKANAKAETKADPKAEATAASKPKSAAELKTEAAPADGLKLSFAQAAWVEVRDGRGEVVAFGVKPAGSQQEIKGQPPFSLVLGNAKYVAVEYQGKPVALEPHISKGVARLSVK
ncbi:MAG: RodZ domain-containing protein [Candidatus Accumulibacter phosphatis]|jgi:cytoskeleton protein RodZ|uniref:helix-turn-helix domain-containing protein n=1 Tax=Candidatus Accumulibacter sp. ACC012 TaxID=2823332 RepID=UPI0025B8E593|nr:RodZ domain-containing protein [Candidatus Accumulibacter sp. ACC012]